MNNKNTNKKVTVTVVSDTFLSEDRAVTLANKMLTLTADKGATLATVLRNGGLSLDMPCGGLGSCGKCLVTVNGRPCLACRTKITDTIIVTLPPENRFTDFSTIPPDNLPSVSPLYTNWGISVDIGTTTVWMALWGHGEATQTLRKNPQTAMGADIISRIGHARQGGLTALTDSVRATLREMITELASRKDIRPAEIDGAVITGNTTMLYLLTGKNPASLATAPFAADCLFGETVLAGSLKLNIAATAPVYLPRCISAFVGADTVTAILASGMVDSGIEINGSEENRIKNNDADHNSIQNNDTDNNSEVKHPTTALLADIGTNGELVLAHQGTLFCTSTAAGPAFEGASLSCGAYGVAGAIDRVWVEHGKLSSATIRHAPAVGICGSGIVDALAAMRTLGIMDETGYLESSFELRPGVSITLPDIRKIQLAKGALRAGMETLMEISGVTASQIKDFLIAGSFGNHLNLTHAATIGLLPPALLPVARGIGNSAHIGASMLLRDKNLIPQTAASAKCARTISLNNNPIFNEYFIKYMNFD